MYEYQILSEPRNSILELKFRTTLRLNYKTYNFIRAIL